LRLLRTFVTSDAVEGAVEVRMELSEALQSYRSRLRLLALALGSGVVLVVGSMLAQTGSFAEYIGAFFEGTGGLEYLEALMGIMYVFFFIISLSLGLAIIIFIGMMRRYLALMRARYGTITGGGMGRTFLRRSGREQKDADMEAGSIRDPARAILGLAQEAEEQVFQMDDLLKYSTTFAMFMAMMSFVAAGLTLLGVTHVPEDGRTFPVVVHLLGTLVLAVAVLLSVEAQRFINHFILRVSALETFESQGPVPVPQGGTALERFAGCVISRQGVDGEGRSAGELEGASGNAHAFDLTMGGPEERVLVRAFEGVPTIHQVRDLRTAAEDVARRDGGLPLRVVALVEEEQDDLDVDDVVYDYLMEHPILDERGEMARSLQIVAEVEGYYSVLPFTMP
jgi:hypothetical protein